MTIPPLTPAEFFLVLTLGGMLMLLMVLIPVKLAAKYRRMRRARTHLSCRICSHRFLRPADVPHHETVECPHCGAKN